MGLIESIKNVFGRRTPKLSDRDRIGVDLVKEYLHASELAGFLSMGYNRADVVKIMVEIDGVICPVGILGRTTDPLMEYFVNWVCAKKIQKAIRVREYFEEGRGGVVFERLFERIWGEIEASGKKEGDVRPEDGAPESP
jgi:hypothetical protein